MSDIDDILSRVDIVDIVSSYVNLKKTWRNYTWLCPFHSEKTPSFVVSEEKQIFKCFGCGKWWNAITFLKEIENLDFYDALKILAEKAGVELKSTNFKKNEKEISQKETLLKINKTALNFFHKELFEDEKALNYLQKERGLSKELIIKYKLGYAPKESNKLIKYLEEKWFKKEDILLAGLGKKTSSGSVYAFFTNRIIFPVFSSLGDVVAFSWRIFNWEENTWKYINTPETIVYHKSNILYNYNNAKKTKKEFLIVVEGYMDVIWLDQLGYENAVATCWTALTEQHIKLLKRVTNKIVFAFDNDNAGLQASLRGLKIGLSDSIYPFIYQISWWKDFDELAHNWAENLDILANSKDGVEFFIEYFLWNYQNLSPVEKQEKLEQVFELLRQIPNYSIFWDYLEKVAKLIQQDVNIVYQQIKMKTPRKFPKKQEAKQPEVDFTIPALFYNNFYQQFNLSSVEEYVWDLLAILDYMEDEHILKKILLGNISDKEKEKLLEKQLWWEEKLSTWTADKIEQQVKNDLKKYLINLVTNLVKSQSIDNSSKMEIMKVLNKLRR